MEEKHENVQMFVMNLLLYNAVDPDSIMTRISDYRPIQMIGQSISTGRFYALFGPTPHERPKTFIG